MTRVTEGWEGPIKILSLAWLYIFFSLCIIY
jgi:hypothetical protein